MREGLQWLRLGRRSLCISSLLIGSLANAAVTPAGSVNTVGGDPADDGPVLPTAGDLIVPDSDTIVIDGLSTLTIDGGSFVRSGGIANIGAAGDLTVSGAGTRVETVFDTTARIVIDGTFNILDGAVVDAALSAGACGLPTCGVGIANSSNSNASMRVSGPGSTLNTTEAFTVGSANFLSVAGDAVGTLLVDNGGVINADRIGFSQGNTSPGIISQSFVTITGAGSQINTDRSAILSNAFGEGAESTLIVENQGLFNAGPALIASAGVNTVVDINVLSGGVLRADFFTAAQGVGSVASILLDGAGSRIDVADDLIIGQLGSATLDVTGGGIIAVGGGAPGSFLGAGISIGTTGGSGSLLVDASSITMTPNTDLMDVRFNIGLFGTGDATIQNAATVLLEDLSGQPGAFGDGITVGQSQPGTPGNGSLDVQGAGTALTVNSADIGFLVVGLDQAGTDAAVGVVDIGSGATLDITGTAGASGITLGRGANSDGTLNVSGAGTTVNVLGAPGAILVAGDLGNSVGDGDALFTVSDGAVVNINSTNTGQSSLNVGLGTGNGVLQVTDATINLDGVLNVSLASAQNSTQSGLVEVNGAGVINAIDVSVGDRGTLTGAGTVNANTLSLSTGATVDRFDLSTISTRTLLTGGTLNLSGPIELQGAQSLSATDGGVVNIDDANLSILAGSTITLSDPGTALDLAQQGSDIAEVAGGVFLNDQAAFRLAGVFNLRDSGILGGDGGTLTANQVNVLAGGSLSPGNSPGILNISGDVELNGGSILLEIGGAQPGEFDVLNLLGGDLNLNAGTVEVDLINGFNPGGQSFDVFTVNGAINLDPAVDILSLGAGPDFEFSVSQVGALNIGTVTFLSRDIAAIGTLNRAQRPIALYMDDVCPKIEGLATPSPGELDLDNTCGNLRSGATTDQQVATAIDAISPDDIIGAVDSLFRFTTIQHGNLARRLNGLRNGAARINLRNINIAGPNVSISGEDLQDAIEALADESYERWGFFSDGRINFGDRDESVRVRGFDFDTLSFTVGTDYRLRRNLYLGIALGYNEVDADFDAGGGLTQKTTTLSLLATYFNESSFYVDLLATYGISDLDTARRINYTDAGGTVSRKASGSTDGDQLVAGLGAGFDFGRQRWAFGPHAGLNYSDITVDSFEEKGAGGLNFAMPQQETRSLTANAGMHVSYTLTPRWGVLVPYARADYVHEFESSSNRARVRFVNDSFGADLVDPTSPAVVNTDGSDANYVVWSVGAHAQFIRGVAAFLDYRGTVGLDEMDLSEVTVGLRYEQRF
ncbi:MAG: autotransporter domain-containing protein [Pseudomonadales bacterium]